MSPQALLLFADIGCHRYITIALSRMPKAAGIPVDSRACSAFLALDLISAHADIKGCSRRLCIMDDAQQNIASADDYKAIADKHQSCEA